MTQNEKDHLDRLRDLHAQYKKTPFATFDFLVKMKHVPNVLEEVYPSLS